MSQMLLEIYDGRKSFWQWDVGQKLVVLDDAVTEVHLSHKNVPHSYDAKIYQERGVRLCDIPDVFLQKPKNLIAYAYRLREDSGHTITSIEFAVKPRPQPDGYISIHDEEYDDLDSRIDALENRIVAGAVTQDDVEKYVDTAVSELSGVTVHHTTQTLTPEQQAQARENIGAVSREEFDFQVEHLQEYTDELAEGNLVFHSKDQELTEEHKKQARKNIGAASSTDLSRVQQIAEDAYEATFSVVSFNAQTLTPEQKEQARKNIGALGEHLTELVIAGEDQSSETVIYSGGSIDYRNAILCFDGAQCADAPVLRGIADGINDDDVATVGQAKAFYVTATETEDGKFTADKTFAEIKAAYEAGRTVLGRIGNNVAQLIEVYDEAIVFQCLISGMEVTGLITSDNIVNIGTYEYPSLAYVDDAIAKAIDDFDPSTGGESGGYYIPSVSQETPNTMKFTFEASTDGMEPVSDKTIVLPAGEPGHTPQKGVDYFTEADKEEMVRTVLNQIPDVTPGSTNGITLSDRETGKNYVVYVSDGKLTMDEIEEAVTCAISNDVTLQDRVTGTNYIIYVANGKFMMNEKEE